MISQDEREWREQLIQRLSWGQLIEHITINHLWHWNQWKAPVDLYEMPTDRHPVLLSAFSAKRHA